MLRSSRSLDQYTVGAVDGDLGKVVDVLFDDERWAVRYLVVETGGVFLQRRVLISPNSFRTVDWLHSRFNVALTREKVRRSPSVDTDQPISRQREAEHHRYYGYPTYWAFSGPIALGMYPGILPLGEVASPPLAKQTPAGDVHLRSAGEVHGYRVRGSDDDLGHLGDLLVDDQTWKVAYLVIDTSNWWLGKQVLVAPEWATRISWDERRVFIAMTRQAILGSPEWTPGAPVNREYETRLYDHYGRPAYWETAPAAPAEPTTPRNLPDALP